MIVPAPGGIALLLLASGAIVAGAVATVRRARGRRYGRLVSIDRSGGGAPLRAVRYRLYGRPDLVRIDAEGRPVPIELKRRARPRGGPLPSHLAQVWAYCLLAEEHYGRPPGFAILRYGDGTEDRVPWGPAARERILRLREAIALPYDGRARPGPAKCGRCRWAPLCDRSAVRRGRVT
ncbi:MAG: PD-(D/E)XK nuclease family protein [Thermoplasmata archaeon]